MIKIIIAFKALSFIIQEYFTQTIGNKTYTVL